MHRIPGEHTAQVSLAEDPHSVGDLGSDGHHEAFGLADCARTPWRDLDHLDARVRQDRVEGSRELTGPIADEEPETGGMAAEVHDEVAGLLRGPGPVPVSGHAQDMQVAVADLEPEQDVEPAQRHRAKNSTARMLMACMSRTCHQLVSVCRDGAGGIPWRSRIRRIVEAPTGGRV